MSDKKTLLLDANFQVQSFIPFRRMVKFLIKETAEVISIWHEEEAINLGSISLPYPYPSILRLNYPVKRNFINLGFNRYVLFKRDENSCQYCGRELTRSHITVDHILPKHQGGETTYLNCVVSCHTCNCRKGNRTPEQAQMMLIRKPAIPSFIPIYRSIGSQEEWHEDWTTYISPAAAKLALG